MPHLWGTPIDEKWGTGDADRGVGHYPCLYTRCSSRRVFFRGDGDFYDERGPLSKRKLKVGRVGLDVRSQRIRGPVEFGLD
jgi:hypothetical protein